MKRNLEDHSPFLPSLKRKTFQSPSSGDHFLLVIPSDILLSCMFFMEKHELFNFIMTCRTLFDIFNEVASCGGLERRRIDILNKKMIDCWKGSNLLDLFSGAIRVNDGMNVMLTYDSYFRNKSSIQWPSYYYHDDKEWKTVCSMDEAKDVNEKAMKQVEHLEQLTDEQFQELCSKNTETMLPYTLFPQKDTYYLSFDDLVKRRCALPRSTHFNRSDILKIERVITPNSSVDQHVYMDSIHGNSIPVFSETIVRFFKKPQEMTFTDFEKRFKDYFLDDFGRLFIYDCLFEHNKTTKTRERFVISGGSLLHSLTNCGCQDIDIYIINNGEHESVIAETISKVLMMFEEKSSSFRYNIMKSRTTINICPTGNVLDAHNLKVEAHHNLQLVLLNFNTIEELLLFFDLDCCKLAFDGMRVYTLLECLRALKYKINILPENSNTEVNFHRAIKYGRRGFKTFSIQLDHPLSHAIHADYFVERIRANVERGYWKEKEYNSTFYSSITPPTFYHLHPLQMQFSNTGTKDLDMDESYLYPVVLRNVNYYFVELCVKRGLMSALSLLNGRCVNNCIFSFICNSNPEEALKELLDENEHEDNPRLRYRIENVMETDQYAFVSKPSELFSIMTVQDLSKLVRTKYSDEHLRRKFSILHCERCGLYSYSSFQCNRIAESKDQYQRYFTKLAMEHPEILQPNNEEPLYEKISGLDITHETYDSREHVVCERCLNQIGVPIVDEVNKSNMPTKIIVKRKLYAGEIESKVQFPVDTATLWLAIHNHFYSKSNTN